MGGFRGFRGLGVLGVLGFRGLGGALNDTKKPGIIIFDYGALLYIGHSALRMPKDCFQPI